MNPSAIAFLICSITVLWGGLAFCLSIALRKK